MDKLALVQRSLNGFRVLSLNFGGKWKELAEKRLPEIPTFRMYVERICQKVEEKFFEKTLFIKIALSFIFSSSPNYFCSLHSTSVDQAVTGRSFWLKNVETLHKADKRAHQPYCKYMD